MRTSISPGLLAALAAVALLGACADRTPADGLARSAPSSDFGKALEQDLVAQIADPDAGAHQGPPPPSDGSRAALAQTRYQKGEVIQPKVGEASGMASGNSGGSSAGASAAPSAGGM